MRQEGVGPSPNDQVVRPALMSFYIFPSDFNRYPVNVLKTQEKSWAVSKVKRATDSRSKLQIHKSQGDNTVDCEVVPGNRCL